MKRNHSITCPAMRDGYIQWVHPLTILPHEQYRMFGDHGNFCPVSFGEKSVRNTAGEILSMAPATRRVLLKFSEIRSLFCPIEFVEVSHG